MEKFLQYAEEHPYLVGGLTLGAVFILLWLFGFFGSSSQSSQSGGNNLAAAYYAAEAAQTTAATQLQMATVAYGNQTAQAGIQADAAQGIAKTQANMMTTLGQQQAGVAINNQNDALSAANTAASYAYQTAVSHDLTTQFQTALPLIAPGELAANGGAAWSINLPSGGNTFVTGVDAPAFGTPGYYVAAGYPYADALRLANPPG